MRSSITAPLQSWMATLLSYSPCGYQGLRHRAHSWYYVWVQKLALPENSASEFSTLFHVISPATHFAALPSAPASGPLCNAQSIIMLSMNRECKLINIIGTDALGFQFHFPFIRSPRLGRYNGGTLQSTASTCCICIAEWRCQLCGSLKGSWFFLAHVGVQPQPT